MMVPPPDSLPIDAVLPDLMVALQCHATAVLRAPTGAGKTTHVPPALLNSGVVGDKRILMLEPRDSPRGPPHGAWPLRMAPRPASGSATMSALTAWPDRVPT